MNLAIDFGNSTIKAAFFEGDKLIRSFHGLTQVDALKLANDNLEVKIALCSVTKEATHIVNLIEGRDRLVQLNCHTPVPIVNSYETPETLGMDRLAAAVGANFMYPNSDCLVIDVGTCITYDLVDAQGRFQGGSISPGIQMRYKAINYYTAKLPYVETRDFDSLTGKNTIQSIVSGINNGIIGEINWMKSSYESNYQGIKTIICGGSIPFFESKIKGHIFAVPELVLIGLNRILNHNVKNI